MKKRKKNKRNVTWEEIDRAMEEQEEIKNTESVWNIKKYSRTIDLNDLCIDREEYSSRKEDWILNLIDLCLFHYGGELIEFRLEKNLLHTSYLAKTSTNLQICDELVAHGINTIRGEYEYSQYRY